MPFVKEDLACDHYEWSNDSSFTGMPSRRLFDRSNGNQVLFIINSLGSLSERMSLQEFRQAEEMILEQMPTDIKSEMSVYNWLRGLR
jgi:hypothetical protein